MNEPGKSISEHIQTLAAAVLATNSVGYQLYLIGGFRYRLLNASARSSTDIDYLFEGDLAQKQLEIADVLRSKLLPRVKQQLGYEGDVRIAADPEADSPAVRIVETAFYRAAEPGSRIEIPIEIIRVVRLDPPVVRTVGGTVYLTVSEADMIENKIISLLNSRYCRVRDILDIFLFQDALLPEAPARLSHKLEQFGIKIADALATIERLELNQSVHVREAQRLLNEQVDAAVAANLSAAGGAAMLWDSVIPLLRGILSKAKEGTT